MVYGTHFIFNGVDSRDYKVKLSSFGNDREEDISSALGIEPITDTLNDNIIDYGGRFCEVLTFHMTLIKSEEAPNDYFTHKEFREIAKWLTSSKDLRWLSIYDGEDDTEYNYLCRFTSIVQKRLYGNIAGIELEVTCDSPFAYSDIKEIDMDIKTTSKYEPVTKDFSYSLYKLCEDEELFNTNYEEYKDNFEHLGIYKEFKSGKEYAYYVLESSKSISLFPNELPVEFADQKYKTECLTFLIDTDIIDKIIFYDGDGSTLFKAESKYNSPVIVNQSIFNKSVKFAIYYNLTGGLQSFDNIEDLNNLKSHLQCINITPMKRKTLVTENHYSYITQEDEENIYPTITLINNNKDELYVKLVNTMEDEEVYISCLLPSNSNIYIDTLNQVVSQLKYNRKEFIEYNSSNKFFMLKNGINNIHLESESSMNIQCKIQYREKYKAGVF